MADFFLNLGEDIENFFATDAAAILGTAFIAATAVFVVLLLRQFEKK